jgi:hypothetical protein
LTTIYEVVARDSALWDFIEAAIEHGASSNEGRAARAHLARSYARLVESSRATPLLRRVAKRVDREWSRAALERWRGFGERDPPEPGTALRRRLRHQGQAQGQAQGEAAMPAHDVDARSAKRKSHVPRRRGGGSR